MRSGVVYMPQTWRWTSDGFPAGGIIDLDLGPVTAVTAVAYVDEAGDPQTMAAADYFVDTASATGRIVRLASAWPAVGDSAEAVSVEFTAGRNSVPASIAHAIMVMAAQSFDDRAGDREAFGLAAQSLVGPHRRIAF